MTTDQSILILIILLIFVFLVWGRVRYDLVAFAGLVAAFLAGVVPKDRVLSGFGHPAVIIIALVLIVSKGLSRSGAIDMLTRKVVDSSRSLRSHIGIMAGISATFSSFMNNVAALALLMPMDMQAAQRAKRSPALTLMPLSFASILGGMVTLIGTPPNIVIATFREDTLGTPFGMWDFAPVGAVVALVGVLFVALIGWRLIPAERSKHNTAKELENLTGYIAEVKVPESSEFVGKAVPELDALAEENDVYVLGLVRRGKRLPGFARSEVMRKNDLVVIEGSPDAIDQFVGAAGMEYVGNGKQNGITSEVGTLIEVVVPDGAWIEGRSVKESRMLYRQNVTLLGISRKGQQIRGHLRNTRIKAGDILLMLGPEEHSPDVCEWLGCLPLAERGLEVTQWSKACAAIGIFASAIIAASLGIIYLPLALAAVVIAYVGIRIVPLSQIYDLVEWPVVVLLASMIPIGAALEASGGTALIAKNMVVWTDGLSPVTVLVILMILTMTLSDLLNNVATALIAAPIAIEIANRLGVNPDAFLMSVAVAASCAFLTPIGHKNNIIIMGPGGYKFGDYWRMGLPLEVLVILVSVPMILMVWPL